jgi:hypothetical protein
VNLNDLFEQIKDRAKTTWDKVQESPTYQQAMEKYEDLPAPQQRLIRYGGSFLLILFLLSPPISTLLSSQEAVDEFNRKRDLTRELLRVVRDSSKAPNIPQAPTLDSLQARFQQEFVQRDKLLPEQILYIQASRESGRIIPDALSIGSLSVSLKDLNLRQILDVGYRLATVSPSVKMTDLDITASIEKPGYFNFTSKIVALKAPELPVVEPEPIEEPRSRRRAEENEENSDNADEGEE